jgi:hypothetical protein
MLLSGWNAERLRLILTRRRFHTAKFQPPEEGLMENKQDKAKLQSDVLRSEHHTMLSPEEIAKAVQRHNREHKDDARKSARQANPRGKKS